MIIAFSGCTFGGGPVGSQPGALKENKAITFADLGWSDDRVISADSLPAIVRFQLPDGAVQGDPVWYGLRLKFQWLGNPGQPGDFAFLYGGWNGEAVYQFKTKRLSDLDEGFHWSMVDAVNGGSHGYESGPTMVVTSTNFAQIKSVKEGWNELSLFLGLLDASNREVRVLISKESEIVATRWGPAHVVGSATADVRGDAIDVLVEGRNMGWDAHDLEVKVIAWNGYDPEVHDLRLGGLERSEPFELRQVVPWRHEDPPVRVDVEVDWGTGRGYYIAWDPNAPSGSWFLQEYRIFGSTIGMVVSVVGLWVTVPWLWGKLRRVRFS